MLQVFQNLKDGAIVPVEVPVPESLPPGFLGVRTTCSVISPGTERMLAEFSSASILGKIYRQPEKVRQIIEKIRTDGMITTLKAVRTQLDQLVPFGYSSCGQVVALGEGIRDFKIGDRVTMNGAHATYAIVPNNLCARIPESVDDESAAYTVLSAIALQGIRLAEPQLGETFIVYGLGLLGLLSCMILKANGCKVIGLDLNQKRLALAQEFGAIPIQITDEENPVAQVLDLTGGHGVDGVLLTVATSSNEPIHLSPLMCRKRGRIVLVGVTGLNIARSDFYHKEISFRVSCSYGPGRYEKAYEEQSLDYPIGFVRWTEQRNFEAALELMAQGTLRPRELVTHRISFSELADKYHQCLSDPTALGISVHYSDAPHSEITTRNPETKVLQLPAHSNSNFAVIGAGGFSNSVLLPAFIKAGGKAQAIASARGISAAQIGRRFKIPKVSARISDILEDSSISTVVIATRHDTHAQLTLQALAARKNVFVEKPLALLPEEVWAIEDALQKAPTQALMVGFNRRFSPHAVKIRSLIQEVPCSIIMTINAGTIPQEHWTRDANVGGGRIRGEVCHFIDLARYLAGSSITTIAGTYTGALEEETCSLNIKFENGSSASIHYLCNGNKKVSKERIEVFCSGKIIQLDNFMKMKIIGNKLSRHMRLWRQDKGHQAEATAFMQHVLSGEKPPIPWEEIKEVSLATLAAVAAIQSGQVIKMGEWLKRPELLQDKNSALAV